MPRLAFHIVLSSYLQYVFEHEPLLGLLDRSKSVGRWRAPGVGSTRDEGLEQECRHFGPLLGFSLEAEPEKLVPVLAQASGHLGQLLHARDVVHGRHRVGVLRPRRSTRRHLDHGAAHRPDLTQRDDTELDIFARFPHSLGTLERVQLEVSTFPQTLLFFGNDRQSSNVYSRAYRTARLSRQKHSLSRYTVTLERERERERAS